ncbi:tetratricopeptide repeat protein [Thiocystis violascens]|uniref:protein O-GlcNAc transferase n=1 Tax=Thiocystis violascens (strain ATCC 17096 / DSM 198 / 6111) TaxID=765911 RepID=I3Y7E8_THIV6|nr:tetratricopeptide repeat protein [Thiocystis violascens]AFL72916.1 putative O-linked N-acetylglucosamine transferase, SPINDLY family [Thiocystis violascens DSM 198]
MKTFSDLLAEGLAHHGAGRLDIAEGLYRRLLERDADHPEANHVLGVLEVERGRFESGLTHLQRALERSPETGAYWQSLAEGLLLAGQSEDALSVLEQALASGLDTSATRELKARIERAIMGDGPVQAEPVRADHDRLLDLLRAGRLAQAESLARQLTETAPTDPFGWKVLGTLLTQGKREQDALPVLELELALRLAPGDAETLNSLGRAYQSQQRLEDAVDSYRKALEIQSDSPEIWNNLGISQQSQGYPNQALASFERALTLQPDYVKAHNSRGRALRELGRVEEALACHDRALNLDPKNADAHNNRGLTLMLLGRIGEAIASYTQALLLRPEDADTLIVLGLALSDVGRFDEALTCYKHALAIAPDSVPAYVNQGISMHYLGRDDTALACFDQALSIDPDAIEAWSNRGIVMQHLGRKEEALTALNRALEIKPDFAMALNNRGNVLKDQDRLDDAIADYMKAVDIKPDFAVAYSNALFVLNYHPDKPAGEIFAAYRDFNRRYCEPHRVVWRAHANDRDPERRLRVGYVSADYRGHSAHYFLEPLLANHDKGIVEITAYSQVLREDVVTTRFRDDADRWVKTLGMSDSALAERIRADRIDILVDLAGHTGGNRLEVFARRPAPVSLSWMGYGYTTGLTAIDYFLTDEVMAPPGSEALFAEQPWRIAVPSLVYRPAPDMGAVSPLPALARGHVTFGTLTRSIRINHRTVRVWSAILDRLPAARLVIDSKDFTTVSMQRALAARFATHGIAAERLAIGYSSPPWGVLRSTDIGLDCFPHNSGTTLIESLYMGVPYVTLAGRPSVGRIGGMMLTGAGLEDWIAVSEDEYIEKAVALASDLERLATLRSGLRARLEAGPWRDEAGFARRVEAAYRAMWRRWCAEQA